MPEIPLLPEDPFSDNQCLVWRSGSHSPADLSKLISLGCKDPVQRTTEQDITLNPSFIPIITIEKVLPHPEDANWKDYYLRTLRTLTCKNLDSAGE